MKAKTEALPFKTDSPRKAIKAKCWDCEGRGSDPCWEWRVGNCSVTGCPLWKYRPYQAKAGKPVPPGLQGSALDEKAVAELAKLNEWQAKHPVAMCVVKAPCKPEEGYCRAAETHGVQVCSNAKTGDK